MRVGFGAKRTTLGLVWAACVLAGCGGGEDEEASAAEDTDPAARSAAVAPDPVAPQPVATAPQISGKPQTQALVNQPYSFVPTASDADGDVLLFTIANRPAWLKFNQATGALSGTPTAADVGTYRGITIQVTDGKSPATLTPFDIQVVPVGQKSVTLSWQPPTLNEDGTPLKDLAGYRIRYGEQSGTYSKTIEINNPGVATYVVDGLVPSTYYFVMSSVNTRGVESRYSNEAVFKL